MYLKVKAVAKMLSLSERHVYRLINKGTLPAIKLDGSVLVNKEELLDYLNSLEKIKR